MGNAISEKPEKEALFKLKLIEKLLEFSNQYEMTLANIINETKVPILSGNDIENQEHKNKPAVDIVSLWKKAGKQK